VASHNDSTSISLKETESSFRLTQPSIAFQWRTKKNNFHEIELSQVWFGKVATKSEEIDRQTNQKETQGGQETWKSSFSLRYEYVLNFRKKATTKLVPSIGFGAGTYFNRSKTEPLVSNSFPAATTQLGLKLYVTPRLSYYFNPRWFLDVNLPICASDLNMTRFKVENPAFTSAQQTSSSSVFETFPKMFSARIGIGLKL